MSDTLLTWVTRLISVLFLLLVESPSVIDLHFVVTVAIEGGSDSVTDALRGLRAVSLRR